MILKSPKTSADFLEIVKLSVAVDVLPSCAVAVQTQLVVQTIESSYFPVTVPFKGSHAAEMSSWMPFHAPEHRYPIFAAQDEFQVTEYASETVAPVGVLMTDRVGEANASAGTARPNTAEANFVFNRIFGGERINAPIFI